MEKQLYRGDIYMLNFIPSYTKQLMTGLHPAIIISNNKTNSRSDVIYVLPVTSNLDKLDMAMTLTIGEESGLLKPSVIICSEPIPINKNLLINKVGFCNKEIMKAINKMLCRALDIKMDFNIIMQISKMIDNINQLDDYLSVENCEEIRQEKEVAINNLKYFCKENNIQFSSKFFNGVNGDVENVG